MQYQIFQNFVGWVDVLINVGQFDVLMDFYCDDVILVVKLGFNVCGKVQICQVFDVIVWYFEYSL